MNKKILIGSIFAAILMLSLPIISTIQAQSTQTTPKTNTLEPRASVFIFTLFGDGGLDTMLWSFKIFVDGKFRGFSGIWTGLLITKLTLGDHTIKVCGMPLYLMTGLESTEEITVYPYNLILPKVVKINVW
ncbi:MAG: hypothetical protein JSW62_01985 [Thermoplasmatales archaeon]|nr:MAG: hypothetical protein JSW62_01985 [Thermoplasmatales archaeon]